MSDLKKILSRLKKEEEEDAYQLSQEDSQEVEGGVNLPCTPRNSGCFEQIACTG